jgi:hypothetical protein
MLIAIAGIISGAVFTSAMVERGVAPSTSPEAPPIVGVVPVDGE